MSQFADFQSAMGAALRDSSTACPEMIVEQNDNQQSRRFNIYRNNRMVSLLDNLQATYPTISRLVGEEFFRAVARLYIDERPPVSPVMAEYGAGFAVFLAGLPHVKKLPYIADMATLEWSYLCSYHAANATSINPNVLSSILPGQFEFLCFSMHPTLFIVSSRWPVGSIYESVARASDQNTVDMNTAQDVLIVRPELEVQVQILPADGAMLLKQLQQGEPVLSAVDYVAQRYPDFDPGTHLQGLIGLGAFNDTYIKG